MKRPVRGCALACALTALLIFPALAQTNYRVAGIAVSSTDGTPLARARISLQQPRSGQRVQSILTADDGHYEFTNVPAGKFALTAAKRGYLTASYEQHGQFSTAIVTGAGIDTEHLTLRLPPLAQISGQVFDEHGDPIHHARVTLWGDDHSTGIARTRRFNTDSADDQGFFEFAPLPPGTYFLSVTADPWYAVHPHSSAPPQDVDRSLDVVYPTTYYSGATESDDATPILLRAGDRLQLDLHLLPVPALHVHFRAPAGQDLNSSPMLFKHIFDDVEIPERQAGQIVSPGVFEIVTAPGRFNINLPGSGDSPPRTADLDITQDNQELDASSAELLASLNATVEILGEPKLPQPLFVSLRPTGHRASNASVDADGACRLDGLVPGKYTVTAFTRNQPFSVSSIARLGPGNTRGKAIEGNTIDLAPGSNSSVVLTLIGGTTTINGFVKQNGKPFAGAMVVLVPAHPDANRESFRRDQSDLDGSFVLQNVVPGTYTAVAIEDGWDLDWSKPNVIARYAIHGQRLTIAAASKTQSLPSPIELQPK